MLTQKHNVFQHEMQLLRIENERLQTGSLVQNCRGSSEQQLCVESLTPSIEFHREMSGAAISSRPINLELEKLGKKKRVIKKKKIFMNSKDYLCSLLRTSSHGVSRE